jgi:hypothetical protein
MPRWTVTKKFKSPPKSELVEDPEPRVKSSEWDRRWQQRSNEGGYLNATYRREKPTRTEEERPD